MKALIAFLTLLPTLALADLGDSRRSPRHYPRDWVVSHRYNKEGIAIEATYTKPGGHFTDEEVTQIFQRNGMPVGIWNYFGKLGAKGSDGVLVNQNGNVGEPGVGATLEFSAGDLGVGSITVGS
jgi:hypothetical protein